MQERVEVHTNPRVDLTAAQMRRAFSKPRKKSSGSKSTAKKKGKKGKRRKKNNPKVKMQDLFVLILGAAVTAALEVYVFRNKEYADKIPKALRQYSGAVMALTGVIVAMMVKGKFGKQIRPAAFGVIGAGAFLQIKDQLVQMRKDAVLEEVSKWSEDVDLTADDTGTDGLGIYGHRYPAAPNMTPAQAAAALGMQSRIPYHPYTPGHAGLGVFDYSRNPGLGVFVDVPTPMDPSNDPRLDPGGLNGLGDLGVLVDSGESGAWLEGQFAYSDSDYRTPSW